jgi:hypothetical protein
LGLNEIKQRKLARFEGKNVEDYVVAGYNYPVSVKVRSLTYPQLASVGGICCVERTDSLRPT